MDLLDWHRGSLSTRRLSVLVKHMPRDSAVNRDLCGEATDWDASTHLLAAAVDHLAVANWMTGTINGGEDSEPLDFPDPAPRPVLPESPQSTDEDSSDQGFTPASMLPSADQLAHFFT